MRHSLRTHLIYLENSIQEAKNRLTQPGLSPIQVEDLQLQVALGESALEHYRHAYALELSLAGSEPPPADWGGNDSNANPRDGRKPKPQKPEAVVTRKRRAVELSPLNRNGLVSRARSWDSMIATPAVL